MYAESHTDLVSNYSADIYILTLKWHQS